MTALLGALALTLFIEVPLGFLVLKSKNTIFPLILINVLTNPALNTALLVLFSLTQNHTVYFSALIIGEFTVFVGEGFLLRSMCSLPLKHALIVSVFLNACSLFLGSVIISLV